jgi:hypothetical protein
MRTTVRLDDQLLKAAKRVAAAEGKTLTALLDESLRARISRTTSASPQAQTSLPTWQGDGFVGDLDPRILFDNTRLADLMDEVE